VIGKFNSVLPQLVRFDVFTEIKIWIEVLWVMIPCSMLQLQGCTRQSHDHSQEAMKLLKTLLLGSIKTIIHTVMKNHIIRNITTV